MTQSSEELNRLLCGEVERRLPLLSETQTAEGEVRAALHSLKGSAAMAGYADLALVIGQFSARLREQHGVARREALAVLESVAERLRSGRPPLPTAWPEPPPGLGPSAVEATYRADYNAAMRDRLGELDTVLSSTEDALDGLERAKLGVHAMKGAAGGMGDEVTAWYCHGLEARLRAVPREPERAAEALVDLARHRALLTLLLEDPARAIETLRAFAQSRVPERPAAQRKRRSRPPSSEFELEHGQYVRMPERALDAFSERLERVDTIYDELVRASEGARKLTARLREIGSGLQEARRQIGPAHPWGPPETALARIDAALGQLRTSAANVARGGALFRRDAEFLHARTAEMRAELSTLRRTSMRWLFERVAHAISRHADAEGKQIDVVVLGGDVPIDRRLAERLLDTVLQLARNAVAHGIESAERRAEAGKPLRGRIVLSAEQIGEWVRVVVDDDGRGADVERIRELAVTRGAVTREAGARARDEDLLAFLFLPGLTTHERADLLAGRGLGLDLVQDTVHRLGGTIRLSSRASGGLRATFEVPSDQTLVDVLWLEEQGQRFALPVGFTGRIDVASEPCVRLARCLGQPASRPAPLSLELSVYGILPIRIGFESVGDIERVSVRTLPDIITQCGPYTGAILRSDGALLLVLDAPLIAVRAWTIRQSNEW